MQQKKAFSPLKGRKDRGTTLVRHPLLRGPSGLQLVLSHFVRNNDR
ncbi:hypothetical protein [Paenibacillus sp. FSL R5-192]|nr:hypothetical protein [Paenibacillus sp. FSL R5-192]